jgi:hypothetical protein
MRIRIHCLALLWTVGVLLPATAYAQADFPGCGSRRYDEDQPERIPGPELRDYAGLPINANARQFADSWDPSRITLPEEQCRCTYRHISIAGR